MVPLTQRLSWMQEAKVLKEHVDVVRHKEVVLKVRLQPWIDKAYTFTASIEGKLMKLHVAQQNIQSSSSVGVTKQHMEEVQQIVAQRVADVVVIQTELEGLRAEISAPTQ